MVRNGWRSALVCACAFALTGQALAAARPFTFDDYARIAGVEDPQIAPDGKSIAIVVSRVNEKKDRHDRQLVLVDAITGSKRSLTFGRDDVDSPRWSPDGTQLAFIDGAGDDKIPQIWVMPMNGGEAHTVTHAKRGVEVYAWRPDGKAFTYVTPDTPANQAAIERHDDLFHVDKLDSFLAHAAPVSSHIWVQELRGGEAQRVTSGSWSVYPEALSWSADGRYIGFDWSPSGRFNSALNTRAAFVDVASKHVTQLASRWSLQTSFAPNGDRIAYSEARSLALIHNDLVISAPGVDDAKSVRPALDRDVDFLTWFPDGKALFAAANDRVQHALWRVSIGGTAQRIDLGPLNFDGGSVARDGGLAFVASAPDRPSELYYLPAGSRQPKRLTDYNASIAQLDLARSTEFTWHNDGFAEDGVLTYPLGYVSGRKYPLALVIHGGPTDGASTASFNPLVQILASHGLFVLQPNYRGSDNLGFRYANAIVGTDPIAGVGSDCMAGLKALLATGMIDSTRVGASGWSAGGWTTSWLITHYDAFKAAVTGAAVDDVVMQATFSEINDYTPILFGGLTPWTESGMQAYRRNSPLTYAKNVRAATLILSDTQDPRVPTPQSYEFFSALQAYGKTVEFVAVPAYGHHPSDPARNKAIDRVWSNWLIEHLSL